MPGTIGERLKKARENIGLKQNKVCELLSIPKTQTLSAYERDVNNPPLEMLAKLSNLYHVSIDWIVCGEEVQHWQAKRTADYISDLFNAIDRLGLLFIEEIDEFNDQIGYSVRLRNDKLRGFNILVESLYKIYGVKDAIDYDDFQMLIHKKINDHATKSNDFEEETVLEPVNDTSPDLENDGFPF